MMITNMRAAVTSSRNTTRTRALFDSGFSLFGRQSSYPGRIAPASMVEEVYGLDWMRATPKHAGGGTRTPTLFRTPGPKPGPSTSSGTPAGPSILFSIVRITDARAPARWKNSRQQWGPRRSFGRRELEGPRGL